MFSAFNLLRLSRCPPETCIFLITKINHKIQIEISWTFRMANPLIMATIKFIVCTLDVFQSFYYGTTARYIFVRSSWSWDEGVHTHPIAKHHTQHMHAEFTHTCYKRASAVVCRSNVYAVASVLKEYLVILMHRRTHAPRSLFLTTHTHTHPSSRRYKKKRAEREKKMKERFLLGKLLAFLFNIKIHSCADHQQVVSILFDRAVGSFVRFSTICASHKHHI